MLARTAARGSQARSGRGLNLVQHGLIAHKV
jgi:hypothetical protein